MRRKLRSFADSDCALQTRGPLYNRREQDTWVAGNGGCPVCNLGYNKRCAASATQNDTLLVRFGGNSCLHGEEETHSRLMTLLDGYAYGDSSPTILVRSTVRVEWTFPCKRVNPLKINMRFTPETISIDPSGLCTVPVGGRGPYPACDVFVCQVRGGLSGKQLHVLYCGSA